MSSANPKLSVVMPVHNAASFVSRALDSVLGQSLEDLELICVDDGSTDGSLDILKSYAAKDARVRVIAQENLHAGPARNAGLEAAHGEYVHFLDADDYALPFAYEVLYNKAKKHDLDLLRCAAIDWDVSVQSFVAKQRDNLLLLQPGDFDRLVGLEDSSPIHRSCVAPWAGIFRRSFLMEKDIRFGDLLCVNDRAFFDAAITNADRMMICRDRVVCHLVNQENSLVSKRAEHFDCQFRSIEQVVARMRHDGVDMAAQERILREEFNDLFYWYGLLSDGSELGNSIEQQTAAFVRGYEGPFAYVLKEKYLNASNRLSVSKGSGKQIYAKVAVRHEKSESRKVSVVVPVGNEGDRLNETLESLTKQTLEDCEFICVDCGSEDGSMSVVQEYAALDGRFRIVGAAEGIAVSSAGAAAGLSFGAALNRGIDEARGEYVAYLMPGDFAAGDLFARLYDVAKRDDLDCVRPGACFYWLKPDGTMEERPVKDDAADCCGRVLRPLDEPRAFKLVAKLEGGIVKRELLQVWGIRWGESSETAGRGPAHRDPSLGGLTFCFKLFCRAERALFLGEQAMLHRQGDRKEPLLDEKDGAFVDEELRCLEEWLARDAVLAQKAEPVFLQVKAAVLLGAYRRCEPECQRGRLHRMSDELAEPLEQGRIDASFLGASLLAQLCEIAADPDAYCDRIQVSVVMPVYNAQAYIRQSIDSLLGSNDLQFELICVDDGSTDGTLAILCEYEDRDPRVRIVEQQNAGAGAARNAGLRLARGEYLSFLDADDLFEPGLLGRAYARAREQDADIVVYRCDEYHEDGCFFASTTWTIEDGMLPAKRPFAGREVPANLFKAFVGWPWDKLFRTDFVRGLGLEFQEQRTTNDMLFVYSALAIAERITTLDEVLVHRRMHEGSLSATRERSWTCFHDALCALRRQLVDWGVFEEREQDFVNYCLNYSLWNLNTLSGQAYRGLYAKLKDEWLEEFGILGHRQDYFYVRDEYVQLQMLLSSEPEEFLDWQLERTRRANDDLRRDLQGMRSQLDGQQEQSRRLSAANKSLDASLERQKRETGRARAEAQSQRAEAERQRAEAERQKAEAERQKAEVKRLRTSNSWKVGRAVTWLPRKIKHALKHKK